MRVRLFVLVAMLFGLAWLPARAQVVDFWTTPLPSSITVYNTYNGNQSFLIDNNQGTSWTGTHLTISQNSYICGIRILASGTGKYQVTVDGVFQGATPSTYYPSWSTFNLPCGNYSLIRLLTKYTFASIFEIQLLLHVLSGPAVPSSDTSLTSPTPAFSTDPGYFVSHIMPGEQVVTTTEGALVPEMSCNPLTTGITCQSFDGDKIVNPSRLGSLCSDVQDGQSYALTLSPTCNGSQYRNAIVSNLTTQLEDRCTSASPDCWLVASSYDEISLVVDLDNDEAGNDFRLMAQPLLGGSGDVLATATAHVLAALFYLFVSRKKVESGTRSAFFILAGGFYVVGSGSTVYYPAFLYYHAIFECTFSALDLFRNTSTYLRGKAK